jgi:hypothetical protein
MIPLPEMACPTLDRVAVRHSGARRSLRAAATGWEFAAALQHCSIHAANGSTHAAIIIIPPASHDVIIHDIEAEIEAQASASHNAATRERTPRHNSVRVGL